ncbi:MAG TPA: hypothetical protein VLG49_06720 [Rhabdochlamydiaceae bacterium]|nr:hypothetical protein [Rhabdochlamydiaceae bacterium]
MTKGAGEAKPDRSGSNPNEETIVETMVDERGSIWQSRSKLVVIYLTLELVWTYRKIYSFCSYI